MSVAPSSLVNAFAFLTFSATAANSNDWHGVALKKVGVVLAPSFEMLDAMGPYETFKEVQNKYYAYVNLDKHAFEDKPTGSIQCSGGALRVEVQFVAAFSGPNGTPEPISSSSGVSITPTFDLASDPGATEFDLLVFGAGSGTNETKDYLAKHHARGGLVMSVCTGASVLAELGLLDGHTATTNSLFLSSFVETYPKVKWVSLADNLGKRFMESTDQITTCAGISAGIDGALRQAQKWCGQDVAEATRECLEWPLHLEKSAADVSSASSRQGYFYS